MYNINLVGRLYSILILSRTCPLRNRAIPIIHLLRRRSIILRGLCSLTCREFGVVLPQISQRVRHASGSLPVYRPRYLVLDDVWRAGRPLIVLLARSPRVSLQVLSGGRGGAARRGGGE